MWTFGRQCRRRVAQLFGWGSQDGADQKARQSSPRPALRL